MRALRPLALAAFALLVLGQPGEAQAHAVVVRTDPAGACSGDAACADNPLLSTPPPSVGIWFSEPVSPVAGGIRVFGPTGTRVERGPATSNGTLVSVAVDATAPGTYQVTWSVVASDTHPARGGFRFSVGRSSVVPGQAAVDSGRASALDLGLQAAARALHFVGFALTFGAIAFRWLVLRPLGLGGDSGRDRRVWRLVDAGIAALLIAEPLALLAQAHSLGDADWLDEAVLGDALASSFGRALGQRLAAALLLWVLVGLLKPARDAGRGGDQRLATGAVLGLGLALATADGEAAHAGGAVVPALGFALNAIHVAAMGLWVGGLATLLLTWREPRLEGQRTALLASCGRMAAGCLVVLLLSGGAMALQHLTGPSDLLAAPYGEALALKLALVGCALIAGLLAFRAPAAARHRWWALEALVLLGILVLAALLVSLPPPA